MGSSLPPLITSRSLYLLTFTFFSCSHAGVCNVITDAVKSLNRPIYMVIGGLHLAPPDQVYRIAPTVEFISKSLRPAPTYVLPMHCTGFKAKIALEHELGEGCVPAGVGMKVSNVLCLQLTLGSLTMGVNVALEMQYHVKGDEEAEKMLGTPEIRETKWQPEK